jgi:GNAT superfamily N-acetyltransferase
MKYHEIAPFVSTVAARADAERLALGFMPESVYEEAALQGKLWVATTDTEVPAYLGHLLFGGVFPVLRVFQIFIDPAARRRSAGAAMLAELIRHAESLGYLTITARVADDLEANAFWQAHEFNLVRRVPGGSSRQRIICLRERKLSTPTLFDDVAVSPSDHDLRLAQLLNARPLVYSMDVNVVLDLTQARDRASAVRKVIAAGMANVLQLYVAPEFRTELARASAHGSDDPLLMFASALPEFPAPPADVISRMKLELAGLIFPGRTNRGTLKPRDESDILHLVAAIHHGAAGFITSENAILKKRWILQERFGLDVVGVVELAEFVTPTQWTDHDHVVAHSPTNEALTVREMSESERPALEAFLHGFALGVDVVATALAPGHRDASRRRLVLGTKSEIVGLASWSAPQRVSPGVDAYLVVNDGHVMRESAIEVALYLLARDSCQLSPAVLRLYLNSRNGLSGTVAAAAGFRDTTAGDSIWHKICLGQIVHATNWAGTGCELEQIASLRLAGVPPPYQGPNTMIRITSPAGTALTVGLQELEDLIGPALLVLPERRGTIVPIRAAFAGQLLDTAPQGALFPKYEASLLPKRIYFSHTRTLPSLVPGTILFFYESQKDHGRGAVIACARSVENRRQLTSDIDHAATRRGVLENRTIRRLSQGGHTCVTTFDMVFRFGKPVSFSRLRELGCADGSNLVTSRPIRYDQVTALLKEGQPHV